MRKTTLMLSIIICILMFFEVAYADQTMVAEEKKPFDITVYENAENYKYDQFDKIWKVHSAYSKKYSDAVVVFGLEVIGDKDSIQYPPYIYVWIRESNNIDIKYEITGLQIIANEIVFSAKNISVGESGSFMLLDSKIGKRLLSAIAEGDELAFKVLFRTGSLVEEVKDDDYLNLKQMAQLIVDNDTWAYVADNKGNDMTNYDNLIEKDYPIEIIE